MNRWTFCPVLATALLVVSSLPALAQPTLESKVLRDRSGDILFTPASRVLRSDGSLKGEYAEGLTDGLFRVDGGFRGSLVPCVTQTCTVRFSESALLGR